MRSIGVATLNLWGRTGRWRDRMHLAAQQLVQVSCDALLVQEASESAGALATEMQMQVTHLPTANPEFGLAILTRSAPEALRQTRLPSPEGEDRWLLSVRLAEAHAWLHCTHLSHKLEDGHWRKQQVLAIAGAIDELESDALHVLGGDMNADPASDEMRFLRGHIAIDEIQIQLQDCWLEDHPEDEDGFTWCMQSGAERAARSNPNDRRIDYLYTNARRRQGQGGVQACSKICNLPDDAGNHASDHCGVWAQLPLGA